MANSFFRINKGASFKGQASAPADPATGDMYFDTTLNSLRIYYSGSWHNIGSKSFGRTINAQTGTSYTFALTDGSDNGNNPLVTFDNASAINVTVPANGSVAFPVGTQIDLIQLGNGVVNLLEDTGVTINSYLGALSLLGRFTMATLFKTGTNTWELVGDLQQTFITATGGTITTDGDYKVHTFTSSGTFQITSGNGIVDSLIVAGGGGGGSDSAGGGGGGGAGGLIYNSPGNAYNIGSFAVTVGAGGAGGSSNVNGSDGSNSSFDIYTAVGGGGGGGQTGSTAGRNGGSGGGGDAEAGSSDVGGLGTVGQGNDGGDGFTGTFGPAGGGGGAGFPGVDGASGVAGNGGDGISVSISGTPTYYAGGGGGGIATGTVGTGGQGGGANGSTGGGINATANTGGGGGGASGNGGNGADGVVILRYKFQ